MYLNFFEYELNILTTNVPLHMKIIQLTCSGFFMRRTLVLKGLTFPDDLFCSNDVVIAVMMTMIMVMIIINFIKINFMLSST